MNMYKLIFDKNGFKFKVPDEIKSRLRKCDIIALTEIGLPKRILSNKFVYYETCFLLDNDLILGFNEDVNEWILKINLNDFSIYYSGKGSFSEEVFAYYNSSVSNLILSLFSYHFFVCRLIDNKILGSYYDNTPQGGNFEKYAELLKDLIFDIDERATREGVWCSLIQEMSMGVI